VRASAARARRSALQLQTLPFMARGFRIGRIFGIDLTIDWSWLFIFTLLTWNLAVLFGHWHVDWSPALTLVVALGASLLFFASVLAHELAHALVAIAYGIPVKSITLFLFGGVSNIEREPPSAKSELLMAIVGPLTSIALGVSFLALGAFAARSAHPLPWDDPAVALASFGPITTLLFWLGPINITLGIFNLVPGFPLDGGRVLRSILWLATGDLRRATRWASATGQAIGWLFIFAGVAMVFGARVPFFGTGTFGGLWIAFIGWFLSSAAQQSYQQLLVHDVLEGVPVARIMRRSGYSLPEGVTLGQAVNDWFLRTDEHAFPVMHDSALVGLLCLHDVRRTPQEDWDATTVERAMTPRERLVTTTPNEQLTDAVAKLNERGFAQLPVIDETGALVGMLELRDVARWLELRLVQTTQQLRRSHAH
jgi:Zn-dependent protease/CBS domain-containing protein